MSITADGDGIVRQAANSTEEYLHRARRAIDDVFGEGYGAKHPELIGQFLNASSRDYAATTLAKEIEIGLHDIANTLEGIGVVAAPPPASVTPPRSFSDRPAITLTENERGLVEAVRACYLDGDRGDFYSNLKHFLRNEPILATASGPRHDGDVARIAHFLSTALRANGLDELGL